MKNYQESPHADAPRNPPRKASEPRKDRTEHIEWTALPTDPQVRRRSTDALPWRPTPRMRWER